MNDEQLIELVRERAILYDKQQRGYKLPQLKARAWREISEVMNANSEECAKRWTTLRDRFTKECRRMDVPSGSGAYALEPWSLFNSLLFLKCHVKPRNRTRCSVNIVGYEEEGATITNCNDFVATEIDYSSLNYTPPQNPAEPTHDGPSKQRKRKVGEKNSIHTEFADAVNTFKQFCGTRIETQSGSEEIISFANIIKAKLQRFSKELQNSAMQDILNYCIHLENYQEGYLSQRPYFTTP